MSFKGHIKAPRLVFCSAKDLEEQDPRLSGCNIDRDFFRLAHRYARTDSNGLFRCRTTEEKEEQLLKHDSWCSFKIKQVQKNSTTEHSGSDITYIWQQPSAYISWNTRHHVTLLLCMDTPKELQETIQDAWDQGLTKANDPYEWHCLIIGNVIDLYDESVWGLRDIVRQDVEKRRSPESTNFEQLHDIARHIIHSNETLEVALNTLDGVQEAHKLFSEEVSSSHAKQMEFSFRHTQLEISHLRRTFNATFLRSKSLNDRIHNEINLAYNLANQRDSFLMKTIAVMTLIYLPGTYLASIFGMNFFDFSPSNGLILSDMFWVYWVLTVIMTLITVGTWMAWQGQSKHARKTSIQGGNQDSQPAVFVRGFVWARAQWRTVFRAKSESPV